MATTADEPLVPRTKVTRAGWYALFLVSSAQAMSLLDRQILSILAPAIREDLQIGDAELGLLYGTVFSLFYALFSLPLGRLADGWIRTRSRPVPRCSARSLPVRTGSICGAARPARGNGRST